MANEYTRGATIVLEVKDIKNPAGQVVDPATVEVHVTDGTQPIGTTTVYTYAAGQITRDSVGNYHKDLDTSAVTDAMLGYWVYSWNTTGTPQHAEKNTFRLVSEKVR